MYFDILSSRGNEDEEISVGGRSPLLFGGSSSTTKKEIPPLLNPDRIRILEIALVMAGFILIAYYAIQCQIHIGQSDRMEKYVWFGLHFFFYLWLAWMFPHEWLFLFALGALWEVLEYYTRQLGHTLYGTSLHKYFKCQKAKTDVLYEDWSDLIANALGIATAVFLVQ